MDFYISELYCNYVEAIPGFKARAAFTINSASVFKENVDFLTTIMAIACAIFRGVAKGRNGKFTSCR